MHLLNFLVPCLLTQVSPGLGSPILDHLFPPPTIDQGQGPDQNHDTDQSPIPMHDLPTLFPPTLAVDSVSTETIRKTLALYPLAIDGKNFAALESVFAPDAVANYSAPLGVLTPVSAIQKTLSKSLDCVTTQHSLGTQLVDVIDMYHARSITYYTAAHFGKAEEMKDQVATAHGQYQDEWVRVGDGTWRIVYRNLVYMSEIVGNQGVFVC
ncbi:hypothetical protein BDV06DRAFT_227812 [Aspergillus oleicola]